MQGDGDAHAEQHYQEGQEVEAYSAALEAGEESGAHLQSYAVDEEYQSEFLEELEQVGVEGHPEVAERYSYEQYPGHSEADSGDLYLAHYLAEGYHQGEYDDGVRYSAAPDTFGAVEECVQEIHKFLIRAIC